MTEPPRFYVYESTGYPINASGTSRYPMTEVLVLDREQMHEVVWSSWTTLIRTSLNTKGTTRLWPMERRRDYARQLCDRLNAGDLSAPA